MEENLAEVGIDIGNAEVNVDEEIPSDQEIVSSLEVDEVSSENDNKKNLNNDLENNSDSK